MRWFSVQEGIPAKDAIEGEDLVVNVFPSLDRRWLVSMEPDLAVCISHGCNLQLTGIPENRQALLNISSEAFAVFHLSYRAPRPFLKPFSPPEYLREVLVFPDGRHLAVGKHNGAGAFQGAAGNLAQ